MNRLEKLVIQAFKPSEGRAPIGLRDFIADHYEEFAKFHSLVAQEIIQDYENAFEPTVPMSITYEKHHAIKSKWGIE